ncbi:DinB family protein [Aliifodinibius salicampi]|uniref:DinB family protein n=1 Tax=Fodinibius salicampi TaxID=1920655 RepID=A0ABT3Q2D5_9BACT|nr:DinB family protein [Fodinibius salicampi]MCW9714279.1 DinB family protein [Fodinibius salicampi]
MKKLATIALSALIVVALGIKPVQGQEGDNSNSFKQQFSQHFDYASRVLSLAKAMPAEKYSWRPEEGVSSVEEVYTHIARYNFYYPENSLGIPAPEDIDVENIESITGKEEVVAILERSIEYVKEIVRKMDESKLKQETELYGRTVNGQAVLMQLITHKSEHVGQSIAYARMNGVVPPWSE